MKLEHDEGIIKEGAMNLLNAVSYCYGIPHEEIKDIRFFRLGERFVSVSITATNNEREGVTWECS